MVENCTTPQSCSIFRAQWELRLLKAVVKAIFRCIKGRKRGGGGSGRIFGAMLIMSVGVNNECLYFLSQ